MNPEIEKLIDHALADGKLTEKEKDVILRKAEKLGEDVEEVEIILEAKLHELQNTPKLAKEKHGNIKTCPACGASIDGLKLKCDECGHEFTNIKANSTLEDLESKIKEIERKASQNNSDDSDAEEFIKKHTIRAIINHPIPNTKSDLLDLLAFMSAKVISYKPSGIAIGEIKDQDLQEAYEGRSIEIINKLKLMASNDSQLMKQIEIIESKIESVKKKTKGHERRKYIMMPVLLFLWWITMAFFARLFGYHFWPF